MSRTEDTATERELRFGHAIPILRVSEFQRSIDYYRDTLGFQEDWRDGRFGSVTRGDASIMLSEASQGCTSPHPLM